MLKINIILATHNAHKVVEFKNKFQEISFQNPELSLSPLLSLNDLDFEVPKEIAETGKSFEENALIKAQTIFSYIPPEKMKEKNIFVLSDDSGLVVPNLNGEPGIYSARYAKLYSSDFSKDKSPLHKNIPKDTDNDSLNRRLLLDKLKDSTTRDAYFNTTLVFYGFLNIFSSDFKKENTRNLKPTFNTIEGKISGKISLTERGTNGFGYDSIFVPDLKNAISSTNNEPNQRTFAEMTMEEKNNYSHRSIAIENFKSYFKSYWGKIFF